MVVQSTRSTHMSVHSTTVHEKYTNSTQRPWSLRVRVGLVYCTVSSHRLNYLHCHTSPTCVGHVCQVWLERLWPPGEQKFHSVCWVCGSLRTRDKGLEKRVSGQPSVPILIDLYPSVWWLVSHRLVVDGSPRRRVFRWLSSKPRARELEDITLRFLSH
jgi:hypothetical protein